MNEKDLLNVLDTINKNEKELLSALDAINDNYLKMLNIKKTKNKDKEKKDK